MSSGILFLDDDDVQMLIYKKIVSDYFQDQQVFYANEVSAAEEVMRSVMPRLMILDLMLPRENGADLLHKLKKEDTFNNIKIIVTTAAKKGSLIYSALSGLVDEYITKPVQPLEFSEVIRKYL